MTPPTASHPTIVAWLGYGGLLPFVGTALALALDPHHTAQWLATLKGYAAVILSFVGALHWGFAMAHPAIAARNGAALYAWSVVPSLLGWVALLVPHTLGLALLIGGFAAHAAQDWRLVRQLPLPSWYLPLRLQLSTVACLCLASAYFTR